MTRLVILSAVWGAGSWERRTILSNGRVDKDGKTRVSIEAYNRLLRGIPRGVRVKIN